MILFREMKKKNLKSQTVLSCKGEAEKSSICKMPWSELF